MGHAHTKLTKTEIQQLCTISSFNKDELTNLFEQFKKFDTDSNGVLDRNGIYLQSGSIDFKELVVSMSIIGKGTPEEKLGFMFDVYDKDKSGTLEASEIDDLSQTMVSVGKEIGTLDGDIKTFVDKLLQKVDVNHDLCITRDEWISQGSKCPSILTLLGL
ncbi:hypothetical protein SAMD00019534_095590 [Acytostelium subglobosum LB1]|uniref:hypothetical protein n=1 Tax=Acytostelium subglobosum LB1 TaxID=1410327 RepID=UPI000644BFFC|nr:hypothetical protein SAMD00019534_095590 [Acytostelium subglobosum LB1]GAM26384.1 hypothetical protein SAMD00019534_095590 [Acytostelium subglobosum LB1]|eukprot:XP_012750480.1 hypothetical protein SAMD00019534_095590 [Acytostelium subglobosum LB1]